MALTLASGVAFADVVYITGATQPSGLGANADGSYTELTSFSGTSAFSTALGAPPRTASRFKAFSGVTNGEPFIRVSPTLGVAGGTYQVHYTHSSTANNTITNAIIGFTNAVDCSLSFTETEAFQRKNGQPAPQKWIFLGKVTNNVGVTVPQFELFAKTTNDTTTLRLIFDCMRFTLDAPCLDTEPVGVAGPLGVSSSNVVVTTVFTNATKITVYQDSGSGMVEIGSKTSGIVGGTELVPVTGLVKGAQVAATQTVGGQQGCVPTAGTIVGGGANPSVRMTFTIRETTNSGPIGAAATHTSSANLHFMQTTSVAGGTPLDAPILTPSGSWQTFTLQRTGEGIPNSANVAGSAIPGTSYAAGETVQIQVFAYKTVNSVVVYSAQPATSAVITSNDLFQADFSWDAVPGAEAYRLLRSLNGGAFETFLDSGLTTYTDNNTLWAAGTNVFPKMQQTSPSTQWNPSVINNNNIVGQWGIFESINFAIDDVSDTGPFDLYIDNLKNGDTVFQDFENAVSGATDFGFRAPGFSGTTSGNLLPAPNIGMVTNRVADTGTKSFRVSFQWNTVNLANKWLRLTTSGVGTTNGTGNPMVNLDLPISVRVLMLPVGGTLPPPPVVTPPTISARMDGSSVVLSWDGVFRLLEATNVVGPYVPNGAIRSPFTNATPTGSKFYRLQD